ncbi:MAG: phosphomannomutase/phosphoglucomutase [Gammaproteobacteria bacterium]|nr:phosphomannomutase/phosphoglucomutase [Gammaproteobacteria bacterium]
MNAIPPSIFRAYDIRGVVDEQLSEESVELISKAIGSEALQNEIDTLLVGYDGRLSSPALSKALITGLRSAGCNVVNLGLVPTPLLYFATHVSNFNSGVMLTASHNPANYNGLKIVFRQTCLADNQIQEIRERIDDENLRCGNGRNQDLDVTETYIEDVAARIQLEKKLKIVIDCGNAVPATVAPRLFRALGCEVIPLYCDIDGSFPNHHPDPTIPDNLTALASKVKESHADLGIAFDGDGDRLGIVSNKGEFVDADKMLMLLVENILPDYAGAPVVFDVKCSNLLANKITEFGGKPVMHRSGHSFMKQKMQETGAPLGGEFAAHIFLQDRWFGFDDGLYTAALILEILSTHAESSSEVFSKFGTTVSTPEIKLDVAEEKKFGLVDRLLELADFPDCKLITLDGLRVEFDGGWGLVRASNTSPALLLRFEAVDNEKLNEIKTAFKALIHRADNSIDLNF